MASRHSSRTRKTSVPGALMVGLGATLVVPGAAQADPDPEPTAASGPPLSKLDAGDQALARHAQADRPTPAPVKPTPPASPTNAGTPPGDRTGNPANYETSAPKPAAPKPKPAPARVQRIGRGDFETPAAEPATPKPAATKPTVRKPKAVVAKPKSVAAKPKPVAAKPKPVAAKPQAAKPASTAPTQRIGRGDFDPRATTPTPVATPAPKPAKPAPTNAGAPAGDRTGNPASYPTTKPPVRKFDPATLNGPRIQRMGLGDMGPDRYAPVAEIGNGPNPGTATPPTTLEFPGSEGRRVSTTSSCGGSGRSKRTVGGKCTIAVTTPHPHKYKGRHRATPLVPTADITYTTSSGRTANTMTPDGERATIQVTSETLVKLGGEVGLKKLKGLKLSYKRVGGHKTVYQITSTPARIAQIAKDASAAPRANDPTSIRTGDGVLLTEENFTGNEGKAEVKNVQVEASKVEGDRKSAGVQRVGKSTIRITVGKEKFVRTVLRAGAGSDIASLGIYSNGDSANGQLRQVDLDVGTKTGWDIYQQFIATGRIEYRPNLAFNVTERETWDVTRGLYGKLGPFEVTTTGTHNAGDLRRVRNSDGSVDEVTTVSSGKATFYRKDKTNPDGSKAPAEAYVMLENASSKQVREYRERTGGDGKIDGERSDIKVKFTERDLDTLRDVAVKRIQRTTAELTGDRPPSRKEVLEGSSNAHPDQPQLTVEWNIVHAKTPVERLYALYQGQGGRSDRLFNILLDTNPQNGGETPVPGRATVLDD